MRALLWRLQALAFVLIVFPLSVLPCRVGEFLGLLLYYGWRSRRGIAIENISQSSLSGAIDPEKVIKDNFRNYGRSLIEIVKVCCGKGQGVLEGIRITGMENLRSALAKGKGAIFITGHCGNWELLAMASAYFGVKISVVARPLNNPYLNRLLERARARFGNRVIYKRGALKDILSTLKMGGSVGILMDQAVIPNEGYIIDFLGRGAWTTKMPALIARKTGVPVLPAFVRRTERGHEILILPEVPLSQSRDIETALVEDTRNFSRTIEEYIRQNPSDWLWMHKRWKRVPKDTEAPHEDGVEVAA